MISFDLTGKVAVVTGASSGLGQQFARALSEQGCDVAILARRKERLEEFSKELKQNAISTHGYLLPCRWTDTVWMLSETNCGNTLNTKIW